MKRFLIALVALGCSSHNEFAVSASPEHDSGGVDSLAGSGGAAGSGAGTGGAGGSGNVSAVDAGQAGSQSDAGQAGTGGASGTGSDSGSAGTGGSAAGTDGTGGTQPVDPCSTIPPGTPNNRIMNCDGVGSCDLNGPSCPDGCSGFDTQQSGTYMLFKAGIRAGNQCNMCDSFGQHVAMRLPVPSGFCAKVTGAHFKFHDDGGCSPDDTGCSIGMGISTGGSLRSTSVTAFVPSQASWLLYETAQLVGRNCPLSCP